MKSTVYGRFLMASLRIIMISVSFLLFSFAGDTQAQLCITDSDCDDGDIYNGMETCDTSSDLCRQGILPLVVDLIAGGGGKGKSAVDVGDVLVWNDDAYLYAIYIADEPWCVIETHLHIGTSLDDIPQKNGNPIPGAFDYKAYDGCGIPEPFAVPLYWDFYTLLQIAAHAVVAVTANDSVRVETAWANGNSFSGKNWAMYFPYTVTSSTPSDVNMIVGYQANDILRDPTRLNESAMGNMIADAMRSMYPEVEAALMNSSGLRADLPYLPINGEEPGEITYVELRRVLPFGNFAVIETLTGAQLKEAFMNGFSPACDLTFTGTGRFPQISGLKVAFHCEGSSPVIDILSKEATSGTLVPIDDTDTIRLITNDFMFAGGDGYTILSSGTDIISTCPTLLDIVIAYLAENSPVSPTVEGRILGP